MYESGAITQASFQVKFDWGRSAFEFHKKQTDVFVAIDVFSFSYFVEHAEQDNVTAFTKLYRVGHIAQPVLLGCLRNAEAVATTAQKLGSRITVIALGDEIGMLGFRPNFEDLMGAGAVISYLSGTKSTQAESAEDSFKYNLPDMNNMLSRCAGGKLMLSHSSDDELKFVAELNAARVSPSLHEARLFT
jgi:phosphosulfolactate phosphohydrolase-like enzyme